MHADSYVYQQPLITTKRDIITALRVLMTVDETTPTCFILSSERIQGVAPPPQRLPYEVMLGSILSPPLFSTYIRLLEEIAV